MYVNPKKRLGQHFLIDEGIAEKIVTSLLKPNNNLIEIGPGTGVLTKYLFNENRNNFFIIDIDEESIEFLKTKYKAFENNIIQGDFLHYNMEKIFPDNFSIIGNFPYNISTQILFKVFENRNKVDELVGMFQKEVAERICSKPNSRKYGILSVFIQAFYTTEYLFTVNENVFNPPPKVKSGVIRLTRNQTKELNCDEKLFIAVVKTAFNQRRKTIRNSLKSMLNNTISPFDNNRAEDLSVNDFEILTNLIQQ